MAARRTPDEGKMGPGRTRLKLWRLTSRSARRNARRQLRASRIVGTYAWLRGYAIPQGLRGAEWSQVATVAALVHLPAVALLDRTTPSWIDGAWQVSGVLVGLVVTLIIFLLQSAGGHSLRSRTTFSAMLRHAGVFWPVGMALAFLITAGLVERYGGTAPTCSWASTYLFATFVLQVLLFGVVFGRSARLVSTEGVADVVKQAFEDGMYRSVATDLATRFADREILNRCQQAQVSYGRFLARGYPVAPRRDGWIVDVDLNLPEGLATSQNAASLTLTAEVGSRASDQVPLARTDQRPGASLVRQVRQGVAVSGRSPVAKQPDDIFADAVDFAWQGISQGTSVSVEIAVELLGDLAAVVPEAYRMYGIRY